MSKKTNPIDVYTHPNVHSGYQYSIDVLEGKIPNCIYVIGACKRFLKDIEKNYYIFDIEKAERYLRLTQLFNHVKGRGWKTENITYEPWQNFMLMNIMGWVDPRTNERRFRTAHVEVPRGHGKSLKASQMVLYFLALDNPKGNEISTASTKTDQARIVLDSARAMALSNSKYLKSTGVEVLAHKIVHAKSNSFVRALSSDAKSLDGLNDVLCVMDELHAVDRKLFDVIYSGLSKRNDSLLLCITTAGFDQDGVGYSQSVYGKKVALCEHEDDQFFSIIYTIDEGDDIFDINTWKKANPNYGVSVDPITFEAKANKAKITPSDLPNFKVKHLNTWLSEAKAFFSMDKWDACKDETLKIENFLNKKAYSAIDLASKIDLTAFIQVFREDGKYYIFQKAFIPEDTVTEASNVLYDNAIGRGELIATKGEAINYDKIKEYVLEDLSKTQNIATFYDPWNSNQFSQDLIKERVNAVEFRMTTANLSEPMKILEALIREKKIVHNGGETLRWCMSNVVGKEDANGNFFPRKSTDKLKIDLAIALIMAIAGWIQEKETKSIYEERGILSL